MYHTEKSFPIPCNHCINGLLGKFHIISGKHLEPSHGTFNSGNSKARPRDSPSKMFKEKHKAKIFLERWSLGLKLNETELKHFYKKNL